MDDRPPMRPERRWRTLPVLGLSLLFLACDFVTVALPWYWDRAPIDLRAPLVGASVRTDGWPLVENVFVVTGPAAPRLVRMDFGSFEDWELPLASRIHTILDVRVGGSLNVHGLWSPLATSHARTLTVTNMSNGLPASPEFRQLAETVYREDLLRRGFDGAPVERLIGTGSLKVWRPAWVGIANELLVVAAFLGAIASAGAVGDARRRRRARLLAAGTCPWCGYHVAGMERCPECGRLLREQAPAIAEGA